MNMYGWALVIFLTFLILPLAAAAWMGRHPPVPAEQPASPAPKPFDLPGALAAVYGPFPVDTGPLLLLSEQAAANVALEREIRQRCAEAEAKIPPRWR